MSVVRQRHRRVLEIRRAVDGTGLGLAPYSDTEAARDIRTTMAKVRRASPSAIEEGLAFPRANPFCHHCGYVRERMLRAMRQVRLNGEQREWLRDVVIEAILAGPKEGFRAIASTAVGLDSPEFRQRVRRIRDDRGQRDEVRWAAHHIHRSLLDPNAPKSVQRWGDGNRPIHDPSWPG